MARKDRLIADHRHTGFLQERDSAVPLLLRAPVLIAFLMPLILGIPLRAQILEALLIPASSSNPEPITPRVLIDEPTDQNEPDLPLSPAFAPTVLRWSKHLIRWSEEWSLPPSLVATVIQIESCGDPSALSGSGAIGLFQVMPYHFKASEDPWDVEVNARRGLGYLSGSYLQSQGDISLTLAGYNGGHGVIHRNPELWPEETIRYVRWGTGIYLEAIGGGASLPTLESWLAAGGHSLCRSAELALWDSG